VEPVQHGAKVDGGSRRPPAFAAEPLEPISCSPTAVGVTVAVQSHVQVQARTAMARGKQQEASKPSATSPRWAAATRWGAKGGGHFRQGGFSSSLSLADLNNSLQGTCSQERLTWCAQMADFFGWSRSLHESLPLAGAALEAGSASEPLGAPVVDVPTQPPFLLGTAMDLHGDAETLKISVPIQTPQLLRLGGGARSSSCHEHAQFKKTCPLATQLTETTAPVTQWLSARSKQVSRRHRVTLGRCRCSLRRSLPCQCR